MRSRVASSVIRILGGMAMVTAAQAAEAPLHFVTEPFPPYTYASKEQAAGPMVDVLKAVCVQLKWGCVIDVLPWRRAQAMAQRGEADGLFTIVDSPERRGDFHVSVPVIDARYTLFAQAGDDFRFGADRQQLKDRSIGVYGPSGTSIALDALVSGVPDVQVVIEPDNTTVLRKLAAGRYGRNGLAMVNEAVALHLMQSENLAGLQSAGTAVQFAYSFGLSRLRVPLERARRFDAALVALCRSGRTAALLKPYALPASACRSR